MGASVVAGKLYLFGGGGEDGDVLRTVESFDPCTRKWENHPSMSEPRYGAAATALGGRIFLFGGRQENELCSAESFDVESQQWRSLPIMAQPCQYQAAFALRPF